MQISILYTGNHIRLRRVGAEEYVNLATPWYRDPDVLELSEEGAEPYVESTVRAMYDVISNKGEIYLIEVRDGGGWRAVGDAALLSDAIPIVIGLSEFRSRGIGTHALCLLIDRARRLGWRSIRVSGVLTRNQPALRMYRRAGFVPTGKSHTDSRGRQLIEMEKRLRE